MKRLLILPLLMTAMIVSSCSSCNNKKQVQEEDPNVVVLFDGETFEGWRAYNGTEIPGA